METRGALCQKGEEASAAGPKHFGRLVGLLSQSHRYLTPLVLFVSWTQTGPPYNLKVGFRWALGSCSLYVTFVQAALRRMNVGDHFAWEPSVL